MSTVTADCITDGRISYEQFVEACSQFIILAEKNNDAWDFKNEAGVYGEGYLSTTFRRKRSEKWSINTNNDDDENDTYAGNMIAVVDCQSKNVAISTEGMQNILQFRYDVVFSVSHGVPVLYFMISRSCGTLLTLDQMIKLLNIGESFSHNKELWNIVSVQDHPILNVPFFCVHPCKNWDLLKECYREFPNPSSMQFLISWLSIVGNHFGLNLSNKYLKC